MYKVRQLTTRKCATTALLAVLMTVLLSSCKRPEPEDTRPCSETIKITQRNGVDVVQTVSGLYLKSQKGLWQGFGFNCGPTPETRHLVDASTFTGMWANGQFEPEIGPGYTKEQWGKLTRGEQAKSKEPWQMQGSMVKMYLQFRDIVTDARDKELNGTQDWWYAPAIPHKLYPLDLLPNFAIDGAPDPQAGVGPIKSKPTVYWAVQGLVHPRTKRPYVTFCSMNPPPTWDGKDFREEVMKTRDPVWLVQATTSNAQNGNTCRGGVSADNGGYAGGMIDVPGKAVPEIDKVYKAAANLLSKLIVE